MFPTLPVCLGNDCRGATGSVADDAQSASACPTCGVGVLVTRYGRYGQFFGCSEYTSDPPCMHTENQPRRSASMRHDLQRRPLAPRHAAERPALKTIEAWRGSQPGESPGVFDVLRGLADEEFRVLDGFTQADIEALAVQCALTLVVVRPQ